MKWRFDIASDIGGRANQQDRTAVFDVPNGKDARLVVLADGMGGHSDGDLAAQAVVDTAERALADTVFDNPQEILSDVCVRAHRAILQLGRDRGCNPASTCVCLYLTDEEAYWAHVGDSRLYHFQGNQLLSHTRDHTVRELLKEAPRNERVDAHAEHLLYMCLGGQNTLQPEFGASAMGQEDWFLLCSDGFWDRVDAEEAADRVEDGFGDKLATDLVKLATERGGTNSDNVSVVLVRRKERPFARAWRRVRSSVS